MLELFGGFFLEELHVYISIVFCTLLSQMVNLENLKLLSNNSSRGILELGDRFHHENMYRY